MFKLDAEEAAPICQRTLTFMLSLTATQGRSGSDFRTAVGDFNVNAVHLIRNDIAGPPLSDIFNKGRLAGITQPQMERVRVQTAAETPTSLGATLIRDCLVQFALATEGRIIADMTFVSREDVDALQALMQSAFDPAEELAADSMDQMMFQALISLHAAISFHLIAAARPLPRMLNFQFAQSLPTLVAAYRLYADAGRADELRAENKNVHPAFLLPYGRALSN